MEENKSNKNCELRKYTIDTVENGENAAFSVEVTSKMQDCFTQLSGDLNPLHINPEYAQSKGFDDKVVYGMLTGAFYSRLVGMYLPGANCLFEECDIKWTKPVYVGDKLTVYGTVTEIDRRFSRISIKAYIKNQMGEKVARAKLVCGVLDDKQGEMLT